MVLQQKTVKRLFWKGRPVEGLSAPELLEAVEWCYERLTAYEGRLTSFCAAGDSFSDSSEDRGTPKPAVSKEFLEELELRKPETLLVLEGNVSALDVAFLWDRAGDYEYWERIWNGEVELSDVDKLLLQGWLDAAKYYEKNNG